MSLISIHRSLRSGLRSWLIRKGPSRYRAIRCPRCRVKQRIRLPKTQPLRYCRCTKCGRAIRKLPDSHCVVCSYGETTCGNTFNPLH